MNINQIQVFVITIFVAIALAFLVMQEVPSLPEYNLRVEKRNAQNKKLESIIGCLKKKLRNVKLVIPNFYYDFRGTRRYDYAFDLDQRRRFFLTNVVESEELSDDCGFSDFNKELIIPTSMET